MRKAGTPAPQRMTKAIKAENMATQLTMTQHGEQFVALIDSTIAERQAEAERLSDHMSMYKTRAHEATRDWTQAYIAHRDLPVASITPETASRAEMLARQFNRHMFIDSVTVTSDVLTVYTKLLFSDIRVEDGSRVLKRRCIGAFKISINIGNRGGRRAHFRYGVRIDNLLYVRAHNPHWAVDGGRDSHVPCGGEYNEQFEILFNNRDWYNFVDTYIQFLRFSDDSGAYTRGHNWIKDRLKYMPQFTGQGRVREKSSIIVTRDCTVIVGWERDANGDRLRKTIPAGKYRVLYSSNGNPTIDHDGSHLTVPSDCYVVIKYKLYKSIETLADLDNTYLKPLDRLPDGSTLSQALEIITI